MIPISIKPSNQLILLIILVYMTTTILILLCGLTTWLKFALVTIIFINAKYYAKRNLLQTSKNAVLEFWRTDEGFWCLQFGNSQTLFAFLKPPSFVTQFLMILKFSTENRQKIFIILTPNCIGKDNYRRLISFLIHA